MVDFNYVLGLHSLRNSVKNPMNSVLAKAHSKANCTRSRWQTQGQHTPKKTLSDESWPYACMCTYVQARRTAKISAVRCANPSAIVIREMNLSCAGNAAGSWTQNASHAKVCSILIVVIVRLEPATGQATLVCAALHSLCYSALLLLVPRGFVLFRPSMPLGDMGLKVLIMNVAVVW